MTTENKTAQEEYDWGRSLAHAARHNVCGTCGGVLTVAHDPDQGKRLKCGRCGWLDEMQIRKRRTLTQQYRQGETLHPAIVDRLEKRLGGRPMDSKALMAISEQGMMARIDRAKFPQELKPEEKKTLAMAAISYGFDPLMGELSIFQGRPFVTIDGRYRKAQETGKFDGVDSRPATKQEREDWQIPAGDFFFRAEIHVKGASFPFVGWGRVRAAEVGKGQGFKPIENNPQRMAEKRAEAQALRKAFSIPLPSAEDIGFGEETGLPCVDQSTGEIVDAEVRVVEVEVKPETKPETEPPKPSRPPGLITDAQLAEIKAYDFSKTRFKTLEGFCVAAMPNQSLDEMTEKQADSWLKMLKPAGVK